MNFVLPDAGGKLLRLSAPISIGIGGDANVLLTGLLSTNVTASLTDEDGTLWPGDQPGWSGSDGASGATFIGYGEVVLLDLLGVDIGLPQPVLVFQVYYPGGVFGLGAGVRTYLYFPDGAPLLSGVSMSISLTDAAYHLKDDMPVCFTRGTLIETPSGLRRIEDLAVGDLVITQDDGPQTIRWIASRAMPARGMMAPVAFSAGAIGNTRPLLVSQQHRMLVSGWRSQLLFGEDEVLVPARHFVNDHSIRLKPGGTVEYFHMMFDRHQIVFAEGVPTESFHPGDTALGVLGLSTRSEIFSIFPELEHASASYGKLRHQQIKAHEAKVLLAPVTP